MISYLSFWQHLENSLFSLCETIIDLSEKLHSTTDNIITDTPAMSDPGLREGGGHKNEKKFLCISRRISPF